MGSGLCSNGAMMVGVMQGGYKVAVLLSIVAFIASCRLLLYSAVAPAAWLHFAGEPPFTLTLHPLHPSLPASTAADRHVILHTHLTASSALARPFAAPMLLCAFLCICIIQSVAFPCFY